MRFCSQNFQTFITENSKNSPTLPTTPAGIDMAPHPNTAAWLKRCAKNMKDYATANQEGADKFGAMAKAKLAEAAKR